MLSTPSLFNTFTRWLEAVLALIPRIVAICEIFLPYHAESQTKREVVGRLLSQLAPGGHLFISHSETLHGVTDELESVQPSIYRKPVTNAEAV